MRKSPTHLLSLKLSPMAWRQRAARQCAVSQDRKKGLRPGRLDANNQEAPREGRESRGKGRAATIRHYFFDLFPFLFYPFASPGCDQQKKTQPLPRARPSRHSTHSRAELTGPGGPLKKTDTISSHSFCSYLVTSRLAAAIFSCLRWVEARPRPPPQAASSPPHPRARAASAPRAPPPTHSPPHL